MKVVTAKEMGRIERLAYFRGASEEAFMEKAGEGVSLLVKATLTELRLPPIVALVCGSGNNAGDAFVAGRILKHQGIDVFALALAPLNECSPLCQSQARRFIEAGGEIRYLKEGTPISFQGASLLVDGILGTGFHGEVGGLYKEVIQEANRFKAPIVSIDIPSGINGNDGTLGGECIHATTTLMLGLPKVGCFLGEPWNFVGKIHIYNFGLEKTFIDQAEEQFILLTDEFVKILFPKSSRSQHKYEAGYVVGLGGSLGMPGAAMLASESALKAGAGIVRLLHPKGMEAELACSPYELVKEGFEKGDSQAILTAMARASAVFIGPGIGTSDEEASLLKEVLVNIEKPCIIDADALTLIAQHKLSLPKQAILTPHIGEMRRLLQLDTAPPRFIDFLALCQQYASDNKVIVVLKGAPTFIFHPTATPLLCHRGDRGMATAGSGDVLTGIIAALLAQKVAPFDAAALGVTLHATAGECAAQEQTSSCLTARNITENLPRVFRHFENAG